ncbi:hypothetical protein GBF38_020068 [Nibea albiflora]|uniref:Uncharacterized protein n=1 Tax=Nibea albiflora TaxID=240163 RepID=A0ACB7FDY5_NIBAL|nr:hypothetical protein GBF38_020068 [Nibea albiflora]
MASQAWLESSLRRSASLGLEVLERASRRSVDWTSTGPSQTSTTTDEETQVPVKRTHTELDDVFVNIANLMAQMTNQCKGHVSPASEDFFIEVSPGTYTVTAGLPDSQQQTQLVSLKAGESVDLTFNL